MVMKGEWTRKQEVKWARNCGMFEVNSMVTLGGVWLGKSEQVIYVYTHGQQVAGGSQDNKSFLSRNKVAIVDQLKTKGGNKVAILEYETGRYVIFSSVA